MTDVQENEKKRKMNEETSGGDASPKKPIGKTYYFAFDIEGTGDEFSNPFIQIGTALGERTGGFIESRSFCAPVPAKSAFSARTWDWWHDDPAKVAILQRIDIEGEPDMISRFYAYFEEIVDTYGPFGGDDDVNRLVIVTDNAMYDGLRISMALEKIGKKYSMHYTPKGDYLCVEDPSDMIKGFPSAIRKAMRDEVKHSFPHTHWAPDDARHMFELLMKIHDAIDSENNK